MPRDNEQPGVVECATPRQSDGFVRRGRRLQQTCAAHARALTERFVAWSAHSAVMSWLVSRPNRGYVVAMDQIVSLRRSGFRIRRQVGGSLVTPANKKTTCSPGLQRPASPPPISTGEAIYDQLFIPENGRPVSISREEGEYLFSFLKERQLRNTLEVGFSFGCSTAYIISATRGSHIAIDCFQAAWGDLGLANMEKLGLRQFLRFLREPSHLALPSLLREGVKVDFAFIDGGHKYDDVFLDWCYIAMMLNPSGYVFFHDASMRSTQLVAAFIASNRADFRRVPTPISSFVAFQKVGIDTRRWDHFEEFL